METWAAIEAETGWSISAAVREACVGPKLVTIPVGRALYAAGPATKSAMDWGAFEENDIGWYLQGNQLDPRWYLRGDRVPLYEFTVVVTQPTRAVMSKVATQSGAPDRDEPSKFQFYSPVGLGTPVRGRLLGYLDADGRFSPE